VGRRRARGLAAGDEGGDVGGHGGRVGKTHREWDSIGFVTIGQEAIAKEEFPWCVGIGNELFCFFKSQNCCCGVS